VNSHAVATLTRNWRSHMHRNRPRRDQPEQPSGRVMAQQRPRSGGQHRRQALPMQREVRVPDCVDAAMEAMQPPGSHPSADGPMGVAESPQLPDRDNTMLPAGQSGQLLARRRAFGPHRESKLYGGPESPQVGGPGLLRSGTLIGLRGGSG
jgi:hypothetical protein